MPTLMGMGISVHPDAFCTERIKVHYNQYVQQGAEPIHCNARPDCKFEPMRHIAAVYALPTGPFDFTRNIPTTRCTVPPLTSTTEHKNIPQGMEAYAQVSKALNFAFST